jgi:hypothetical protein
MALSSWFILCASMLQAKDEVRYPILRGAWEGVVEGGGQDPQPLPLKTPFPMRLP